MKAKLNSYVNNEVGADTRLTSRESHRPTEPRIQKLIDQVEEFGYAIIPHAFTDEQVSEAKAEVAKFSAPEALSEAKTTASTTQSQGRNTFEGLRTKRGYALANKSRIFDKFALHEDVLALNDYFLEPGYLLNSFQSINILPGEQPQTLHFDDGYVTIPRPHKPFGTAIMIALDEYTADNGATVIVPKSHTWGDGIIPSRSEAVPVIMPAGSMFYFLSTLWHGGGGNSTDKPRLALTTQYCQPWIRQLENQMISVGWEKLKDMPPRLVDMLGYKVGAPFIGHVNGRSPRAEVERILREQQAGSRAGGEKKASRL